MGWGLLSRPIGQYGNAYQEHLPRWVKPFQKWHLSWDLEDEEKLARLRRGKFQREGLARERAFEWDCDGSCKHLGMAQILSIKQVIKKWEHLLSHMKTRLYPDGSKKGFKVERGRIRIYDLFGLYQRLDWDKTGIGGLRYQLEDFCYDLEKRWQ